MTALTETACAVCRQLTKKAWIIELDVSDFPSPHLLRPDMQTDLRSRGRSLREPPGATPTSRHTSRNTNNGNGNTIIQKTALGLLNMRWWRSFFLPDRGFFSNTFSCQIMAFFKYFFLAKWWLPLAFNIFFLAKWWLPLAFNIFFLAEWWLPPAFFFLPNGGCHQLFSLIYECSRVLRDSYTCFNTLIYEVVGFWNALYKCIFFLII